MVTPLYGQRKTVEQNNDIPLLQEHLSRKKTHKGQNHNIKKMHVIEMLHIEMSVVQPAATVQTPLKFRWQMVGYHLFKYRGCLHISQETKESGYMDWCTGQALHGLVSSKDEDKDPAVLRQSDNLDDQSQFTSSLTGPSRQVILDAAGGQKTDKAHRSLISGTEGFRTNPVHLASWLHWDVFWSKFTHDYRLSVATGKL
ncbi:uncharacterized protein LOC111095647 isoform X1 [Canis lupus familiaris]|uniref:uncharacterized protein LOC111095647 isoform X1 n=1 Tax=Canis lupus familiaris TaxID=9615 RepID=UPI0018F2C1C8|nr:uncharacterized protein LOC111095647 isoform X1 [Canis lupus familiaris]XP_038519903.1 uncharacterized protein LOC111095647 isoform X1 [Canis lupus familiaris]